MTVHELTESDQYALLLELKHKEIIPFILKQLGRKNFTTFFFKGVNVLIFIAWGIATFFFIKAGLIGFGKSLLYWFSGAFLGTTAIIPFHEWLHGIAYKMAGAPKVSYRGSFKQMMFYAAADQFVIGMPVFRFVALTPFVIISVLSILGYYFGNFEIKFLMLGFLLSHTIACAGDFGLLSYIDSFKRKELFTYDDMGEEVSYIYEKLVLNQD